MSVNEALPQRGAPDAGAQQQRKKDGGAADVLGAFRQIVEFERDAVDRRFYG